MAGVKVRLAQLAPRPRDVPANLARASEVIASSASLDLVVLPELFLSGYELTDAEAVAVELDGPQRVAGASWITRGSGADPVTDPGT
jgi:predicted amidohydrolase